MPRLHNIETQIEDNVLPRLHNIETQIENNLSLRLHNIEQCYISTYDRYKIAVTNLDNIESDTSLLKKVVCEHSKVINAFA